MTEPTMKERLANIANTRDKIYLPEVLKAVAKATNREDKIFMLRAFANRNPANLNLMKEFVQGVFHPDVTFDLPPTRPPFESNYKDFDLAPGTLTQVIKKIGYFKNGESKIVNVHKRESVFIQCLETLYKPDAEILLMIVNKKLNNRVYPTINYSLAKEAFNGWLPDATKSDKV